MSNEKISVDEILSLAGKKPDEILGNIQKKLPENKKDELFRILGNKEAMEQMLKSEQAQALMKKLSGGK